MIKNKVCLIILDGFGLAAPWGGNAITMARMPNWKHWWQTYPHSVLTAHGKAVGLPGNEIGNSEVGHMTIGAGRVIPQDSSRINDAIEDGSFYSSQDILEAFATARETNRPLHLMGLLSDGMVHSSIDHLCALLRLASIKKCQEVYLHLFTDGRDTGSEDGIRLLQKLNNAMTEFGVGSISTIIGRYYAMDRDHRADRTKKAIDCLVYGVGNKSNSPVKVLADTYVQGKTDEFVYPTVIVSDSGQPKCMSNGDPIIFFNFRSDRAREIAEGLTDALPESLLVTFIPYGFSHESAATSKVISAFKPLPIIDGLSAFLDKMVLVNPILLKRKNMPMSLIF